MEAAGPRHERSDRSVSAGGAKTANHARLPRSAAKFRNPIAIITKNRLVTRDVDLLGELASHHAAAVNVSVTSLDPELQRVLEPRTSSPSARLEAVATLRAAGIPVGVMVAPI